MKCKQRIRAEMDNKILMRHNGSWAAKPDTLVNTGVEKGGGVPSGEPGTG